MISIEELSERLSLKGRFASDVVWNTASFFVLGISGILLNILIGRAYHAEALGVFNQVFALYIFFSQFAVFGIHLSVVKHIAEFSNDNAVAAAVARSGVVVVSVTGLLVSIVAFGFSESIGRFLGSEDVGLSWQLVAPGLWFFSINKVLLGILNGHRHMKVFAICQALRFIFIVAILSILIVEHVSVPYLALSISCAEVILSFVLIIALCYCKVPFRSPSLKNWPSKHFRFGSKSFLSGTLGELNTRIDILMLGIFLSDTHVGIYSMAALVVEGIMQFSTVVRNVLNPVLTKLYVQEQFDELQQLIRQGVSLFFYAMLIVGGLTCVSYPFVIELLVGDSHFYTSWIPFCILIAGFVLRSGYFPFNMLLVQAGLPGWFTIQRGMVVLTNIVLNVLFIPLWGIETQVRPPTISIA